MKRHATRKKASRKVRKKKKSPLFFRTKLGRFFIGSSDKLLTGPVGKKLAGKVQLILTSPPFPLNRKKKYGNKNGDDFKKWFAALAPVFAKLLKPSGSIVIEMGNSWVPGRPVQSLLHIESLLNFVQHPEAGLRLCQQFVCYNPSRLPSPAQWVTVKRTRVTDSFTHVWWLAKSDRPKADNSRVLRPYSRSMEKLLETKKYNSGRRPSEHVISKKGFLTRHKGSIAHNVFEMSPLQQGREVRLPNVFSASNTTSNDAFLKACRKRRIKPHPARMPVGLANFFIHFLTQPGDLVLDPFGGSNTTGFAAAQAKRRWVSIERQRRYATQAKLRSQISRK